MTVLQHQLIRKLADGRFYSGTELGQELNVSRAAIWKAVSKIGEMGIRVHSVRGKGYRLEYPLYLLDSSELNGVMTNLAAGRVQHLEILDTIDSTNSHAMRQLQEGHMYPAPGKYAVYLAEQQTGGKGRRGRQWVSPFGQNIYLTMARIVDNRAMRTEGISLVIGLAVLRALGELGVQDLGVKWPNDVHCENRKLAGILLEITGDLSGECQLLVGVGINVRCETHAMVQVTQPWTDLYQATGKEINRNQLAASVVSHIMTALEEFESGGLGVFLDEWRAHDVMHGKQVELISGNGSRFGKAKGISESGALLLETEAGIEAVNGGEISLRSVVGQ